MAMTGLVNTLTAMAMITIVGAFLFAGLWMTGKLARFFSPPDLEGGH